MSSSRDVQVAGGGTAEAGCAAMIVSRVAQATRGGLLSRGTRGAAVIGSRVVLSFGARVLRGPGVWPVFMVLLLMMLFTGRTEGQISPNCTLGMPSVAFGSYNPLSAASQDTTGTLSFSCNLTAPLPTITLSRGASSTYHPRTMVGPGGGTLSYNVYLDALHTVVWGDGSDLSTSKFVAIGLIGSVTFFGSIPPNQNASAGAYSDSLVATIFF